MRADALARTRNALEQGRRYDAMAHIVEVVDLSRQIYELPAETAVYSISASELISQGTFVLASLVIAVESFPRCER
jgi:hypothetical protein